VTRVRVNGVQYFCLFAGDLLTKAVMEKLWIYGHVVSFSFVLKKGHKMLYFLIEMESEKKKKLTQQLELEEHLP
jgi:hypothetical protein